METYEPLPPLQCRACTAQHYRIERHRCAPPRFSLSLDDDVAERGLAGRRVDERPSPSGLRRPVRIRDDSSRAGVRPGASGDRAPHRVHGALEPRRSVDRLAVGGRRLASSGERRARPPPPAPALAPRASVPARGDLWSLSARHPKPDLEPRRAHGRWPPGDPASRPRRMAGAPGRPRAAGLAGGCRLVRLHAGGVALDLRPDVLLRLPLQAEPRLAHPHEQRRPGVPDQTHRAGDEATRPRFSGSSGAGGGGHLRDASDRAALAGAAPPAADPRGGLSHRPRLPHADGRPGCIGLPGRDRRVLSGVPEPGRDTCAGPAGRGSPDGHPPGRNHRDRGVRDPGHPAGGARSLGAIRQRVAPSSGPGQPQRPDVRYLRRVRLPRSHGRRLARRTDGTGGEGRARGSARAPRPSAGIARSHAGGVDHGARGGGGVRLHQPGAVPRASGGRRHGHVQRDQPGSEQPPRPAPARARRLPGLRVDRPLRVPRHDTRSAGVSRLHGRARRAEPSFTDQPQLPALSREAHLRFVFRPRRAAHAPDIERRDPRLAERLRGPGHAVVLADPGGARVQSNVLGSAAPVGARRAPRSPVEAASFAPLPNPLAGSGTDRR